MVKLHLVIRQLLLAMLASVIIAPNNSHHLGEAQPSHTAHRVCLQALSKVGLLFFNVRPQSR